MHELVPKGSSPALHPNGASLPLLPTQGLPQNLNRHGCCAHRSRPHQTRPLHSPARAPLAVARVVPLARAHSPPLCAVAPCLRHRRAERNAESPPVGEAVPRRAGGAGGGRGGEEERARAVRRLRQDTRRVLCPPAGECVRARRGRCPGGMDRSGDGRAVGAVVRRSGLASLYCSWTVVVDQARHSKITC